MTTPVPVFQYLSPMHAPALTRLEQRARRWGAQVVLDLEDGVQDPLHPERTPAVKIAARECVREFARTDVPGRPLSIRINPLGTQELARDLVLLHDLARDVRWERIIVPKVEREGSVREFEGLLDSCGVTWSELVPTVETVAGVHRLDVWIEGLRGTTARIVQFGHFDYNLDAGNWPFLDQRSNGLWDVVATIIRKVEDAGMEYSHSPHAELEDHEGLRRILGRLGKLCRRRFWMTTLTLEQSRACSEGAAEEGRPTEPQDELTGIAKLDKARELVATFRACRCAGRSFAVARDRARFLSPHEYWGAMRYLRRNGVPDA